MINKPWFPPVGTLMLACASALIVYEVVRFEPDKLIDNTPVAVDRTDQTPTERLNDGNNPQKVRNSGIPNPKILERPLFAKTRRLLAPKRERVQQIVVAASRRQNVAKIPQPLPPKPPNLVLRGTLGRDGAWRALIADPTKEGEWLSEGAVIDGWRVVQIRTDQVLLENSGATHRIELYNLN